MHIPKIKGLLCLTVTLALLFLLPLSGIASEAFTCTQSLTAVSDGYWGLRFDLDSSLAQSLAFTITTDGLDFFGANSRITCNGNNFVLKDTPGSITYGLALESGDNPRAYVSDI